MKTPFTTPGKPKVNLDKFNKNSVALVEIARQTNTVLSNCIPPQVEMDIILTYCTEQGEEITTKIRQTVPDGIISSGAEIPIHYNENKPRMAVIDLPQLVQAYRAMEERKKRKAYQELDAITMTSEKGKRFSRVHVVIFVVTLLIQVCALAIAAIVTLSFWSSDFSSYSEFDPLKLILLPWSIPAGSVIPFMLVLLIDIICLIINIGSLATHSPLETYLEVCIVSNAMLIFTFGMCFI